jgi:hypothetical protein
MHRTRIDISTRDRRRRPALAHAAHVAVSLRTHRRAATAGHTVSGDGDEPLPDYLWPGVPMG